MINHDMSAQKLDAVKPAVALVSLTTCVDIGTALPTSDCDFANRSPILDQPRKTIDEKSNNFEITDDEPVWRRITFFCPCNRNILVACSHSNFLSFY